MTKACSLRTNSTSHVSQSARLHLMRRPSAPTSESHCEIRCQNACLSGTDCTSGTSFAGAGRGNGFDFARSTSLPC
eukprot:3250591-Rhodomonas_salina.2